MTVVQLVDTATIERNREYAAELREIADRVEAGDITEWVIVLNDIKQQHYERHAAFDDRWRLLGALEYARAAAHNGD